MAAGAIRFHGYISWLPDRDRQRQTETDRDRQTRTELRKQNYSWSWAVVVRMITPSELTWPSHCIAVKHGGFLSNQWLCLSGYAE